MEVPKLGVELTTAMPNPSHIWDLGCSLRQCQILNPLSEARDWTCILVDTSWVLNLLNLLSHNRNSWVCVINLYWASILAKSSTPLTIKSIWLNFNKCWLVFTNGFHEWKVTLDQLLFKRASQCPFNFFFFFCFFRASPTAYGHSQAKGWLGAAAASLHHSHSNAGSELHLHDLRHSSRQCQVPNPLSEARDQNPYPHGSVRFVSTAPQQKLLNFKTKIIAKKVKYYWQSWCEVMRVKIMLVFCK